MDKSKIKDVLEWIYCIIIAVGLALLIRYYIGTPTIVKQLSMYPTLQQDERLILNRVVRTKKQTPDRGDIITFEAPSQMNGTTSQNNIAIYDNSHQSIVSKFVYYVLELKKVSYIKRVIGLPGEHLKIQDGKVYINDVELEENYIQEGVSTNDAGGVFVDLVIPEGTVFVMGDNRHQSSDSRRFGCIPINKIESKVLIRFWPMDKWGRID